MPGFECKPKGLPVSIGLQCLGICSLILLCLRYVADTVLLRCGHGRYNSTHHSSTRCDLWSTLQSRSKALDLTTPTFLVMRYASCVFDRPVPAYTLDALWLPFARARILFPDSLFLRGAFSIDYP